MNRQKFLETILPDAEERGTAASSSPTNAPFAFRRTNAAMAGLEPYTGAWNTATAAHLLRRTMFGPRRSEVLAIAAGSLSAAVTTLLSAQADPNPPTGPNGENFTGLAYDRINDGTFGNYLKAWWLALMIKQNISIVEKMTLFWHNHFVTELFDLGDSRYAYYQNRLFRQNALGNFKTLTRAVAIDPAMLRYLNGNQNIKGRPNENFARELQELFTIGKGPELAQGNYTNYAEQDVQQAARVLTGWSDIQGDVTNPTPRSTFNVNNHDTGDKTFSSDYQGRVIRGGTTLADGNRELDELLDMIFSQTATSRYICRKLYRWFVYYDISADVETNVIAPMATILRNNNFEVKPVLDALFKSAHFYDPNNMGCFIRTPIDIVVGPVRQMSATIPDFTNLSVANYTIVNSLRNTAANLLMNLFDPPDVAGWKAFYQIPDFHELWINATTLPGRGSYTDGIVTGKDALNRTSPYKLDPIAYAQMMSSPSDAFKLVDDFAGEISGLTLTQKQKDYLLYNVMLLPKGAEYNWTDAWNLYVQNPSNTTAKNTVTNTLNNLLKSMLRMAEAQLA